MTERKSFVLFAINRGMTDFHREKFEIDFKHALEHPTPDSLVNMLTGWENQGVVIGKVYQNIAFAKGSDDLFVPVTIETAAGQPLGTIHVYEWVFT